MNMNEWFMEPKRCNGFPKALWNYTTGFVHRLGNKRPIHDKQD